MDIKSLVNIERVGNGLSIDVYISPIGLPRLTVLFPTANLGFADDDRAQYLTAQVEHLKEQGWHVVNMRAVRNPIFDAHGEHTTLEVTIRPCMNRREADEVKSFIFGKMQHEGRI